jgi:hypothetical protein
MAGVFWNLVHSCNHGHNEPLLQFLRFAKNAFLKNDIRYQRSKRVFGIQFPIPRKVLGKMETENSRSSV